MADGEEPPIQVVSTIGVAPPGHPNQLPDSEMDALLLGRTRVSLEKYLALFSNLCSTAHDEVNIISSCEDSRDLLRTHRWI